MGEHVSLYVSPINLDPEQPAMPISHPSYYSGYLARRHGAFATLGLAEDTWALNEGVTDDATFLQQAHDIDDERRTMCLSALDQLRELLEPAFPVPPQRQHHLRREPAVGCGGEVRRKHVRHAETGADQGVLPADDAE